MRLYSEFKEGFDVLKRVPGFQDYLLTDDLSRKINVLASVDEGVYFYTLLGMLKMSAPEKHPLFNGGNRAVCAYLTGVERIEAAFEYTQSKPRVMTPDIFETLMFVFAYQHDAVFMLNPKGSDGYNHWDTYSLLNQNWLQAKPEMINMMLTSHSVINNELFAVNLSLMLGIVQILYRKKSSIEVYRTLSRYDAWARRS